MRIHTLTSGIIVFATIASVAFSENSPSSIGSRLELFLDQSLVESTNTVEFRLHHPTKAPRPKSPLPVKHYITILKDKGLFRAYWKDHNPEHKSKVESGGIGEMVAYAESKDGHEWTFPDLGMRSLILLLHRVTGQRRPLAKILTVPFVTVIIAEQARNRTKREPSAHSEKISNP